ncbi:MAG: asparagine synthase-related protein [Pseudomonadota bacterium]
MFAAIFMRKPGRDPRELIAPAALEEALSLGGFGDRRGHWCNERVLMAQSLLWNTPESKHESTPEVCPDTGRVIVSWVRLDNRAELCAALNLEERETLTDPQIILGAHRMWGEDCANRLEGDFSFVIYDPTTDQAFCARDALGIMPFFYYQGGDVFMVASDLSVLQELFPSRFSPNSKWIARCLVDFRAVPDETSYTEISPLPRASLLRVASGIADPPRQYFEFDMEAELADRPSQESVDKVKEAFNRAVRRRLRTCYPLAAEFSGGLDSSGVAAAMMPEIRNRPEQFYFCGHVAHENDAHYLMHGAMHLGLPHVDVHTGPTTLTSYDGLYEDMPRTLGVWPRPDTVGYQERLFQNGQALGARSILSGYGGDQLVTSASAPHVRALASTSRNLPALIRHSAGFWPVRTARAAKTFVRGVAQDQDVLDVSPNFMHGFLLRPQLAKDLGIVQLHRDIQSDMRSAKSLNERLLRHREFSFYLSERPSASQHHARRNGMEFKYPMLDRQLMVQVLKTPVVDRTYRGISRFLFRRAMSDELSSVTLQSRKNNTGARVAPWPWDDLHHFAQSPPAISPVLQDFVDPELYNWLNTLFRLPRSEFDKVDIVTKSRAFMSFTYLMCFAFWQA